MAIVFVNKPGLNDYLVGLGYRIEQVGQTWVAYQIDSVTGRDVVSTGNDIIATTVNSHIQAYAPLACVKAIKRVDARVKCEELLSTKVAGISYEQARVFRELWLSILPASRAPTTAWAKLIEIITQHIQFNANITAATDWAALNAIDYTSSVVWNIA